MDYFFTYRERYSFKTERIFKELLRITPCDVMIHHQKEMHQDAQRAGFKTNKPQTVWENRHSGLGHTLIAAFLWPRGFETFHCHERCPFLIQTYFDTVTVLL